MGILDRIKEIEAEMARTQKNKATSHHLGMLKARIAKLRTQLIEGSAKGSSKTGEGFDVTKSGDARVAMIGFPSVGKSTLLNTVTNTESVAAAYEFTTLTCIPGVIHHKDARIQLLDLPGIIEGASEGKGRGRQVIAVARTADVVLMMLDAAKGDIQKELLEHELETVGIRLNQRPPDITYSVKSTGGIKFNATVPLTHISEHVVKAVLHEYRVHNAEILVREDATLDQFIDVIEGNRVYMRCLYVYNKIDTITIEEVDRLAHTEHSVVLSCQHRLNVEYLLEKIWEYLDLIRIYTKPKGQAPDLNIPVILRKGSTVLQVCRSIHRDLEKNFNYALVWGTSAKHRPQRVGKKHELEDEDVVQIMQKV
eukprot:TRINITY_DN755_c0_g1_i1.p1 TRINITY_DN755_c0_g1~~TRINITY_DN755_c0_g1_i1.p1  ORF type:complete len:367 (+),score=128.01 TRINITY_DN755_c0_g1_i1:108-1208(+)